MLQILVRKLTSAPFRISVSAALYLACSLMALMVSLSAPANAQGNSLLSVPASVVRELTPPGTANGFLRPEGIFVDNRFGEVYVSDPGHNRIVAFDTSGLYKFEFSCSDILGTPGDVVVDSRGFIYVLGSTGSGKGIYLFDYDGLYLRELRLSGLPQGVAVNISHLTIDESDHLYVVDETNAIVFSFDTKGTLRQQFPVLTDVPEKQRQEATFGSPRIAAGSIYLPVSTFGTVYVYDLDGNFIRHIGDEGTDIGTLNFPVDVAIADSVVMVLDKHRYNVVCFTIDGQFLGEFGGMGFRQGWFYHPNSFAVDNLGRCYISQIFLNLVQVCDLPKSIIEKAKSSTIKRSQTNSNSPRLTTVCGEEVTGQLTTVLLPSVYFSIFQFISWRFFNA
jgi:DNA-binding beta-propeller fold protein YncE